MESTNFNYSRDIYINIKKAGLMSSINKILILDISGVNEKELQKNLSDEGFNVDLSDHSSIRNNVPPAFVPDIILAVLPESAGPDDIKSVKTALKGSSEFFSAPSAVAVFSASPEAVLELISSGISNLLLLPSMKDYFSVKIGEFIESGKAGIEAEKKMNFELNYRGELYPFSLSEKEIKNIIIASAENISNQREIVKCINLKKGELFLKKCGEESNSEIEMELNRAVDNDEFRLYYQPVIDIEADRISGFEALIRWEHPKRGFVLPDDFIPQAESTAAIIPMGEWVAKKAVSTMKKWKEKYQIPFNLRININISTKQFLQPDLFEKIYSIVNEASVSPESIGLEITESAFMEDMKTANLQLLEFRSKNFSIYMDDFGSGYSSLSYLMHFPMNALKIDKSFVKWMHIDEMSEEIVKSVIGLAHNLKMKVVAEGVDDAQHLSMLKDLGCDFAQGYYFAKPLSEDDAEVFLKSYL